MITANRRARATIAFFIPRCLAIFIAQALSQNHLAERMSMAWAASNSIVRIMASPHFEMYPIRLMECQCSVRQDFGRVPWLAQERRARRNTMLNLRD